MPRRMDPGSSNYYPPRAGSGWLPSSWAIASARAANRWRQSASRLPSPPLAQQISWTNLFLALVIPGHAYAILGRHGLARWMLLSWCAAAGVLIIFLGHTVIAGWAIGTLASTHSSGVGFFILRERELATDEPPPTLKLRILLPLILWIATASIVYWPGYRAFCAVVAQPIDFEGRHIIVNPRSQPGNVTRGQWLLYRMGGDMYGMPGEGIRFQGGLGFGEVLGLPGDTVEFTRSGVRIHGRLHPHQTQMPTNGDLTVAPGTWFIWPRFGIPLQGALATPPPEVYLAQSAVSQANFVGRPFKRWFFHRQDIP